MILFEHNTEQGLVSVLIVELFHPGTVVMTPGAEAALQASGEPYTDFLKRHLTGDWGDLCQQDKEENDRGIQENTRIHSAYLTKNKEKLWVITEWDRSVTTLLTPDEY